MTRFLLSLLLIGIGLGPALGLGADRRGVEDRSWRSAVESVWDGLAPLGEQAPRQVRVLHFDGGERLIDPGTRYLPAHAPAVPTAPVTAGLSRPDELAVGCRPTAERLTYHANAPPFQPGNETIS